MCLSETKKFGFVNRVDKGLITTVKDSESRRFEPASRSLERIEELWGAVGLYESVEEISHWWK